MEIINKCLTELEFHEYVQTIKWNWNPTKIILHHTVIPTIESWNGSATMLAMKNYYERQVWYDAQGNENVGWSAGPHLFIAPDGIWLFSPLSEPGIHVKGMNDVAVGVEMVGYYDHVKPSGNVLSYTLSALRDLFDILNLNPEDLGFHRDYAEKSCPGLAVTKEWVIPLIKEDTVSKLGIHFQNIPDWDLDVPAGFPITLINPPEENPFPGAFIIGRCWIGGDATEQEYIDQRELGAEAYFSRCREFYERAPYVDVWLGPNEPNPYWDGIGNLNVFDVRWTELMHAEGWKTGVGGFSVGQPEINNYAGFVDALRAGDYLALHQYGNPTMQYGSEWLSLRHRKVIEWCEQNGIECPPIIISETGLDGGATLPEDGDKYKQVGIGWKGITNKEDFLAQMAWYDSELAKDPRVIAATPFVAGPNNDWIWFEWTEDMVKWAIARFNDVSIKQQLAHAIQEHIVPLNPNAALEKQAAADGWVPASDEVRDVSGYVAQGFRKPGEEDLQKIYACVDGDWGNVFSFYVDNNTGEVVS